jgi:hypothetical protein
MKSLRYLALVGLLTMLPITYAQAQVSVGVGIGPVGFGVGPGYVAGPPVCSYGYYPYAPYACAPYGYYGPEWFVGGVFIGAGPWYHGWGHPFWDGGHYRPGFWGHPGYYPRGYVGRGFEGRGSVPVAHGVEHFNGGGSHGGGNFHGGGGARGRR